MAVKISVQTNNKDARYIYEKSQGVAELTPRSLQKLEKLSANNFISTARDKGKIVGWVIAEPLTKSTFELGLGFVEKEYRGQGLLYDMLKPLINNGEANYVFATFEPKILKSTQDKLGFQKTSLAQVALVSRGKFISKRLSSFATTSRVASHLKEKKALYGIKRASKK